MSMRTLAQIVAFTALTAGHGSPAEPSEWPLRIVTVAGQAELSSGTPQTWNAAALRAELGPGVVTRTLEGRLTLRTTSGQEVRVAPRSRISLTEGPADQPTRLTIDAGSVWVAVVPGSPKPEQVEVRTGAVTVTVRGSGVGIALGEDGSALVRVYHGAAECAGPGAERKWARVLAGGQEFSVSSAGAPGEMRELVRDKVGADWVKWNEDQDVAGGYKAKPPER